MCVNAERAETAAKENAKLALRIRRGFYRTIPPKYTIIMCHYIRGCDSYSRRTITLFLTTILPPCGTLSHTETFNCRTWFRLPRRQAEMALRSFSVRGKLSPSA